MPPKGKVATKAKAKAAGKAKAQAKAKAAQKVQKQQSAGTHRSLPPIDVLIKQVDFGDLKGDALETERGRLQEKMQDLLNDAKARNAGYSRLARALTKPVPEGVLTKYTTEKSDEKRKFILLAQFELDPSFGSMHIKEEYKKEDGLTAVRLAPPGLHTPGPTQRNANTARGIPMGTSG